MIGAASLESCLQSLVRIGGVKGTDQAARDNLNQSGGSSPGCFQSLPVTALSSHSFIIGIASEGGPAFDPPSLLCARQ